MDTNEIKALNDAEEEQVKERREFLKKAGKLAITAPAVTLLVSASLKPTEAQAVMYHSEGGPWI